MLKIHLKIISDSEHTSAIITGLLMLEEQGLIELSIDLCYDQLLLFPHSHIVEICILGKVIAFDLLDGYNWDLDKTEDYLDRVDFYFKRSFCLKKNEMISATNRIKIHPLGFNYSVTYKNNPINDIVVNKSIKAYIASLLGIKPFSYFTTSVFEAPANYKKGNLKILFIPRLWEVDEQLSPSLNQEREYINQMRIRIVRNLKKIYPHNFVGGIQYSKLAKNICGDLIVPRWYTMRSYYLNLMKSSDICIGSMGLHESISWKTGEYIAASRAIVNERLHYEVVGPFNEGVNYLSFDSVDQCIQQVSFLMEHPDVVYSMKKENERYYKEYLRPDKLVSNAIKSVLVETTEIF
ncbi:hypothetical protein [uncultured Parabacteroides sp.]|uniref:hypothetical protein n=1 Tax=uncultured Parabacteroides sp. TaxID=512312 RepID=UPI00259B6988|nr:hypothetical protein [uncultured Parabacteroides sp.]